MKFLALQTVYLNSEIVYCRERQMYKVARNRAKGAILLREL